MNLLFIIAQYIVPQHLLSRLVGKLARCEAPWVKNTFIDWFIRRYEVDMSQAQQSDPHLYRHFNDFFTRALKPDARPIDATEGSVVAPADGTVSALGRIDSGRIFQAKGQTYSLLELLAGDQTLAQAFDNGRFFTVYLAPRDYHRVHMPIDGTLRSMTYVPGELFSVNEVTTYNVPNLFSRNERCICVFDTPAGPMVVVLVGAMIVAGIETVWAGQITPLRRMVRSIDYQAEPQPVRLKKGEEMGRFKLGSTVIVLFGEDAVEWAQDLTSGGSTVMGQGVGTVRR